MVHRLRSDPSSLGIVQANGGHASTHAFGLLSTALPDEPYRLFRTSDRGRTRPVAAGDATAKAQIDGITVEFTASEPTRAVALVRFDNGSRTWANSDDTEVMHSITASEWVGSFVAVREGRFAAA